MHDKYHYMGGSHEKLRLLCNMFSVLPFEFQECIYGARVDGQEFGVALKKSLGIPASHIKISPFKSLLHLQFQLPSKEYPGKQQTIA